MLSWQLKESVNIINSYLQCLLLEILANYPLYAYFWKKFVDHEARLGSMETLLNVYERAEEIAKYSVDIWFLSCKFVMDTYGDPLLIIK